MLRIVTNNPMLACRLKEKRFRAEIRYIEGTVKEVVFESRDEILKGMRLITDPLAGRRARTTPYLSVVLSAAKEEGDPKHILRLEELLNIYYQNIEYLQGLNGEQHKDYQILDLSLIEAALNGGENNLPTEI